MPTVDWTASLIGTNEVTLQLTSIDDGTVYLPTGWSTTGIPQFRIRGIDQLPTAVVVLPDGWRLTFADPLPPSAIIERQPNLPDLRGSTGEFLTGKAAIVAGTVPSTQDVNITGAVISGMDVVCTFGSGPQRVGALSFPNCADLNGFTVPQALAVTPGEIRFTFTSAPQPGDVFTIASAPSIWVNETGGTLAPFTTVLS